MVINLASLPQETIEKYDLNELAQDGKIYIERNVRFATGRHTRQRIVMDLIAAIMVQGGT
jgi:hypothetical protein